MIALLVQYFFYFHRAAAGGYRSLAARRFAAV